MPIENLGKNHFTAAEKTQLNDAVDTIMSLIGAKTYNLSPKERSKYGKIGDKMKLLITKTKEYHENTPALQSPDVNWEEFEADYETRHFASQKLLQLRAAVEMMLNIKILHDHDNFQDALRDYQYAIYKNKFGNQLGFAPKIDSLKDFFPKTGKKHKKE
ncbi:MAG TPA: hypothetical protein PK218_05120 [Flavobacterium sp.]|jgi:hypothetical protein|uniref:hypothetical protein n=1 Tax=Flavobacterium sp. TaxID=239 RepID=UPI002C86B25B|nr:hypothetical protein [Flavobacterium sp.]HPW97921.1 hypothetical protein [Flavobacterium sp.]HQA73333.1 hypothetical protein [Flavobacterium sp.]